RAALRPAPARRPALRRDQPRARQVGARPARSHRERPRSLTAHRADGCRAHEDPRAHGRRGAVPHADRGLHDGGTLMAHFIPENLPDRIRHYIDGAFVDSVDGATFDVLDPVSNTTYVQ